MAKMHFGVMLVANPTLDRCIELSKLAENSGFDSLHGADGAGSWDPFILGYIMQQATKRIPILLTVVNPYYFNPVKLGLAAATIQHASKGRFSLSLGGGSQDTLRTLGLDWVHPEPLIRETIDVIRKLLAGETLNMQGKMVTAKGNQIWFEPPPPMPILIGCQRPKLTQLAGEKANGIIIDSATPAYAKWAHERLLEGASRVNRDLDKEIESGKFWFHTVVPMNISEDRKVAIERARASMPYTFQTMSKERRERSGVPESLVKEVQELMSVQTLDNFEKAKKLFTDEVVMKLAAAGTPEDAIRFIKWGEREGYNGMVFHISTKKEKGGDEIMRLFKNHVVPAFK